MKRNIGAFGAVLILTTIPLAASEKIEGAFGQKIGDVFDLSTAVSTNTWVDGRVFYGIRPQEPYEAFTKYRVLVTPTTKRIYCITAEGEPGHLLAAKRMQNTVMYFLSKKYGAESKVASSLDERTICDGDMCVRTFLIDGVLKIEYTSQSLATTAAKELLERDVKAVNPKGL